MEINFVKYQGTGNDFVMLDNLSGQYDAITLEMIQFICDRKVGVGADGLIKLSKDSETDFNVEYFNADGSQSFCGNGARCSVAFAKELGVIEESARFNAIDGIHVAFIKDGVVDLQMNPVNRIDDKNSDYFMDTGSPHYMHVLKEGEIIDVVAFGRQIRFSDDYRAEGVNVNTIKKLDDASIRVETYERGVEDETLSCGTGVTACALLMKYLGECPSESIRVETKGGTLSVRSAPFDIDKGFDNIWLSGPANRVYEGKMSII